MVQNLICSGGSGLTLSWELPATLGSEVVDYRVEVHRLEHSNGTREVVQSDVAGFNTEMTAATVNQGLCI